MFLKKWHARKLESTFSPLIGSLCVYQSAQADPRPLPETPTMSTWGSELDHGAEEEGCLVWWTEFSFTYCGQQIVHVSSTRGREGSRMHGGEKLSWDSVMLWAMFCWESLGPGIHVDVTLTYTKDSNIAEDQIHPFVETLYPGGSGSFSSTHCRNCSSMVWETRQRLWGVDIASKFPRSQSDWASVESAGNTEKSNLWRPHLTTYRT